MKKSLWLVLGMSLIFFAISLSLSGDVINAIIWAAFAAYLWSGMYLSGKKLRLLTNVNFLISLIVVIFAYANIHFNIVNSLRHLPDTNLLIMGGVILILSATGVVTDDTVKKSKIIINQRKG